MTNDPRSRRDELIAEAQEARTRAHAPYSKYKVGAALLLADGSIVKGCNVENASYGLANCAERTAIFAAVAEHGPDVKVQAIAVSVLPNPDLPPMTPTARELSPCGACRQVMAEFMDDDTPVFVDGPTKEYTLGQLLPDAFRIPRKKP